jgi:AmmeMemoRadiSam system protein B/AmmeMemoRadiSam system protein A
MSGRWSYRTAVIVMGCLTTTAGGLVAAEKGGAVRPAYCAGTWYPADATQLGKLVDDLLAKASPPRIEGKPLAIIAPHAGYRFSAPVAAAAYRALRGQTYQRVIVIAFSHRYAGAYHGVDVPKDLTACQTPLGEIPIDRAVCDALLKRPPFVAQPGVDRGEHSLELQLPFLQRTIKDFRLVPLYVGQMSPTDFVAAAEALLPWLDDQTLLAASSDCTHFGPSFDYEPFKEDVPKKLRGLADEAAAAIEPCDVDSFVEHLNKTGDTICGRGPITLLMRALSMKGGACAVRAAIDMSGNMTGDWTNSVTYQSFVFTRRPGTLGPKERDVLLKLARQTVTAVLDKKPPPSPKPDDLPAAVRKDGACFVTLQNHGELRGCIGNMIAQGPLYQSVIDNAVNAATRDYRFEDNPVTSRELPQIHIEISYLTPMKRVANTREIVIGRHGLYIILGMRRGVLLPQVAYERGWSRDEFLAQVCRKAGLPLDAWKQPSAEIHSFEAEVFGEPEPPATQPAGPK